MPGVNPGEVWMIDFGIAAKVRPALLLTGEPGSDEHGVRGRRRVDCMGRMVMRPSDLEIASQLDLVTALLHTTALRGNQCRHRDLHPKLIWPRAQARKEKMGAFPLPMHSTSGAWIE